MYITLLFPLDCDRWLSFLFILLDILPNYVAINVNSCFLELFGGLPCTFLSSLGLLNKGYAIVKRNKPEFSRLISSSNSSFLQQLSEGARSARAKLEVAPSDALSP